MTKTGTRAAHLTSVNKVGSVYEATCVCGWRESVTSGAAGLTKLKLARQKAWEHWASQPVDSAKVKM